MAGLVPALNLDSQCIPVVFFMKLGYLISWKYSMKQLMGICSNNCIQYTSWGQSTGHLCYMRLHSRLQAFFLQVQGQDGWKPALLHDDLQLRGLSRARRGHAASGGGNCALTKASVLTAERSLHWKARFMHSGPMAALHSLWFPHCTMRVWVFNNLQKPSSSHLCSSETPFYSELHPSRAQ